MPFRENSSHSHQASQFKAEPIPVQRAENSAVGPPQALTSALHKAHFARESLTRDDVAQLHPVIGNHAVGRMLEQTSTSQATEKTNEMDFGKRLEHQGVIQRKAYPTEKVFKDLPAPRISYQTAKVAEMTLAKRVEATGLHLAKGNTGTSVPSKADPSQHSAMYNTVRNLKAFDKFKPIGVNLYDLYGGQKTHDAHLLTERFHGQAYYKNLSLAPKEVNMALRGIEWFTYARMKNKDLVEVFDWEAVVNYGRSNMPTSFENAFPTSIEVRATPQFLTEGSAWRDDPENRPYFRVVPVNIPTRSQAVALPGIAQEEERESPFSVETLENRAASAVFLADATASLTLDDFHRKLLDQEQSDSILSGKSVSEYVQTWNKAKIQAHIDQKLPDTKLQQNLEELYQIATRNMFKFHLPKNLLHTMSVELHKLFAGPEFQFNAMRKNVVEYFSNTGYQHRGNFPQEAFDQADFWPQRTLEGFEEKWSLIIDNLTVPQTSLSEMLFTISKSDPWQEEDWETCKHMTYDLGSDRNYEGIAAIVAALKNSVPRRTEPHFSAYTSAMEVVLSHAPD